MIDYKFNENNILDELEVYIDSTYGQHYAQEKIQATEFILDSGMGDGFCLGNVIKYAKRYGRKSGYNRKDLMKILHYTIIAISNHDNLKR